MATAVGYRDRPGERAPADPPDVRIYTAVVSALFFVAIAAGIAFGESISSDVWNAAIAFTAAALVADLLMVRFNDQLSFSLSLPIVLAAAMVLPAVVAAGVGFLSTADISDLRGRLPLLRALFNRSQIGLSTLAASAACHELGGLEAGWPLLLIPAAAAVVVDAVANTAFVAWSTARLKQARVAVVLGEMYGPRVKDCVFRYVAVGLMAPLVATVWMAAGVWGLFAFLLPIVLAWSALAAARKLNVASDRLDAKNDALAQLLAQMADERRDERLALAAELHDEVLPALYKVHLMGEVIKKDLESGQLLQLEQDVPELAGAVTLAQLSIRHVVSNLRDSSIGPEGLRGIIEICAQSLEAASSARYSLNLADVSASRTCHLVVFQVAREAMRNAAKHSKSEEVSVRLWQEDGCVRLVVRDAGVGFDTQQMGKPLHFGLALMAERVEALGGRLVVDSILGQGTTIGLTIPPDA